MIKKLKILFLFLALFSCVKEVKIDFEEKDRKPVISAFLTCDSLSKVYLTKSNFLLDSAITLKTINDATIKLFVNDDLFDILSFKNADIPYYLGKTLILKPGDKCKLEVSYPYNNQKVTSQVIVPDTSNIITIDTTSSNRLESSTDISEISDYKRIQIRMKDNPDEKNFYLIHLEVDSLFTKKNIYDLKDSLINQIDTVIRNPYLYSFLFSDSFIEIFLNIYENNYYIKPTSAALGLSNSIPSKTVLFSDQYINGKEFVLNCYDTYNHANKGTLYISVNCCQITEDYYKYIKSLAFYSETNGDILSEKVKIYSNINNGLGIFGIQNCRNKKIWLNF